MDVISVINDEPKQKNIFGIVQRNAIRPNLCIKSLQSQQKAACELEFLQCEPTSMDRSWVQSKNNSPFLPVAATLPSASSCGQGGSRVETIHLNTNTISPFYILHRTLVQNKSQTTVKSVQRARTVNLLGMNGVKLQETNSH